MAPADIPRLKIQTRKEALKGLLVLLQQIRLIPIAKPTDHLLDHEALGPTLSIQTDQMGHALIEVVRKTQGLYRKAIQELLRAIPEV